MVAAGHGEKAPVRGAGAEIAEPQGFAGAIDAYALAVPELEDTVEGGLAEPAELLRSPRAKPSTLSGEPR